MENMTLRIMAVLALEDQGTAVESTVMNRVGLKQNAFEQKVIPLCDFGLVYRSVKAKSMHISITTAGHVALAKAYASKILNLERQEN